MRKSTYQEIIKWLETHNGEMPKSKNFKNRNIASEEGKREYRLYYRWMHSKEKEILDEYAWISIENIPKEYKERIITLMEYGVKPQNICVEIIEWLETHNGQMPRGAISKDGRYILKIEELTEEEKNEKNLYRRWRNSKECKVLEKYAGIPLEEVPEEFRGKIKILREHGLGLEKTTYEEIIDWLRIHGGKIPRSIIWRDGKSIIKVEEMTEDERKEKNLYNRWKYCEEKKILDKYVGMELEEVPEEFRAKIATLRSLGQLGKNKDERIKDRMKKALGKQVGENQKTREELSGISQLIQIDR